MGTGSLVDVPAELFSPAGIVDTDAALYRYPEFHRGGIARSPQYSVLLLVIDEIHPLRCSHTSAHVAGHHIRLQPQFPLFIIVHFLLCHIHFDIGISDVIPAIAESFSLVSGNMGLLCPRMYTGIQQMLSSGTVELSGTAITVILFGQLLYIRRHGFFIQYKVTGLIRHRQTILRHQKRGTVRCRHRMSLLSKAIDNITALITFNLLPEIPQSFLVLIWSDVIITATI